MADGSTWRTDPEELLRREVGAEPVPERYLEDASGYRGHAERVFVPADEAGVAAILREASTSATPVTIAGAGTGITGARVPFGGWVLSLEKLNRLDQHPGHAVVGPGTLDRKSTRLNS